MCPLQGRGLSEDLAVEFFARPASRLGGAGDDLLQLARELDRVAVVQRAPKLDVGDLAGGGHHYLDRVVRRVHGDEVRRDGLFVLLALLIKAFEPLDGVVDPRLVDLAGHATLLTARQCAVALRDQTVPGSVTPALRQVLHCG
jgi:hypothetical protein